jgi:hypothetical protein
MSVLSFRDGKGDLPSERSRGDLALLDPLRRGGGVVDLRPRLLSRDEVGESGDREEIWS